MMYIEGLAQQMAPHQYLEVSSIVIVHLRGLQLPDKSEGPDSASINCTPFVSSGVFWSQ